MMRFLLTAFAASLCINAPAFAQDDAPERAPWDNAAVGPDHSVVAFVGEKIFVEERDLIETMEFTGPDGRVVTRTIPNMDSRYEARYKILETIAGNYSVPEIDFVAFNHYGRPYFPKVNPVLLFAINYDGEWIHSKYLFYPVHQTTDGDWAICGSPDRYKNPEDDGLAYTESLAFVQPVKTVKGEDTCTVGTRARKVFDYLNTTRFLPNQWRRTCRIELGYSPNIVIGSGSHPTAKAQKDAVLYEFCIERKKFDAFK